VIRGVGMPFVRNVFFLLLLSLSLAVTAGRTPGFSMSAFNQAFPGSAADVVFSPLAFEIDCAVISEAFGPIEKAKYVEALGALVGYENIYRPIVGFYRDVSTNGVSLVSGRAFLTPSLGLISAKYRVFVQDEYGVQACPFRPYPQCAECYLKAAMDGDMEDFSTPSEILSSPRVSFVDLESFHVRWAEPFPASAVRTIPFTRPDGVKVTVRAMADLRQAGLWQTKNFTMLKLSLADGYFFHAVLPAEGVPLAAIRESFAGERLDAALVVLRSVTEPGVYQGPVEVTLPSLDIVSAVDLCPALRNLGLPLGGFKEIFHGEEASLSSVLQRTAFRLDERGPEGVEARASASVSTKGARPFVADRPFLFFVCHEPTRTIPVAGIFAGGMK